MTGLESDAAGLTNNAKSRSASPFHIEPEPHINPGTGALPAVKPQPTPHNNAQPGLSDAQTAIGEKEQEQVRHSNKKEQELEKQVATQEPCSIGSPPETSHGKEKEGRPAKDNNPADTKLAKKLTSV